MGKKIKDKKAKGKAPAAAARKAPPKAAGKPAPKAAGKPAPKAAGKPAPSANASAKPVPKAAPKPVEKLVPAVAKPAVIPPPPPARAPGRPTLGVAAPRPGMGGPKFALPPAKIATAPGTAAGEPRRSKPPPRMSVREPIGADELKAKIGALATAIAQIRALKRSVGRSFWEVGTILGDIRDRRLFEAKGYGSFDAFVEREIELGKTVSLRLARVTQALVKEAAVAAGLDRSMAAVAALDGESDPSIPSGTTTSTGLQRSPIPVHKL